MAVVTIALLSLCVTAMLATALDARKAFEQNDVMFGDDTAAGMAAFSTGWSPFNLYRHPNITYFTGHPVRELTKVFAGDRPDIRRRLALLISPTCGALAILVLGLTLDAMAIAPTRVVLLSWIAATSFAQLLFSSLPTHFSLTSLALIVCLWSVARPVQSSVLWMVLGFFATSITTSNLVPWVAAYFVVLPVPWPRRLMTTMMAAIGVVLMVLAFNTAMSMLFYGTPQLAYVVGQSSVNHDTVRWFHSDVIHRISALPMTFTQGLIGGVVTRLPIAPGATDHQFSYTLGLEASLWQSVAGWLLVLTLAAAALRSGSPQQQSRKVVVAAVIVIVAHAAILGLYGDADLLLYASHWQLSLIVTIAAAIGMRRARWTDATIVVLAVAIPIGTWLTWHQVFASLS